MSNDSTPARSSKILRSPALRWAVPGVALAAVAGGVALSSANADAAAQLPPKTAAQLLADVAKAPQRPLSGTVVETARLGLPDLPGQAAGTSLQSLVTGSHTARVWYGTDGKARVSLVGDLAETDVVHNGRDVWLWSSQTNEARHYRLPAGEAARRSAPSTGTTDPRTAAERALAAVDPTTKVEVDGTGHVAGQAVYELRLEPRDARSLVGSVRVAIDAATSVPLRVQVFAKGGTEPAFETGFTAVQFEQPDASIFSFTPPKGAKVVQGGSPAAVAGPMQKGRAEAPHHVAARRNGAAGADEPTVVGKGWTAVAVVHGVDASALGKDATAKAVLGATSAVSGAFGTGRLLTTPLISVLLVGNTAYVGAVEPAVVEQAAASASGTR
jgi:outer membrane lipoprotein-sorting protein